MTWHLVVGATCCPFFIEGFQQDKWCDYRHLLWDCFFVQITRRTRINQRRECVCGCILSKSWPEWLWSRISEIKGEKTFSCSQEASWHIHAWTCLWRTGRGIHIQKTYTYQQVLVISRLLWRPQRKCWVQWSPAHLAQPQHFETELYPALDKDGRDAGQEHTQLPTLAWAAEYSCNQARQIRI